MNFINKGHSRTVIAKKNILGSFVFKGIGILISFVIVPISLNYITPLEYGLWLTLSSLITWLYFFDFGIGNGLRNHLAIAIANHEIEKARIYVSSAYVFILIVSILILAIYFIIRPHVSWYKILNAPESYRAQINLLFTYVILFFVLKFVLSLINTILVANQRNAFSDLIGVLSSLLGLAIIYLLSITTNGSLLALGIVYSGKIIPILLIISIVLYYRKYSFLSPSIKYVRFSASKDLFSLGITFFIIQITTLLIYQSTIIIVAQLFSPSVVTEYNLAFKYMSITTLSFSILLYPFWSAITEANEKGDNEWIKRTIRKLVKIWIIFSLGSLILVATGSLFFKLWVGEKVKVSFEILLFLGLNNILLTWTSIFMQFINGIGKIRLQLTIALIEGIIFIPLCLFLGSSKMGLIGILIAGTIIGLINAIWAPIQYKKIISNNAKGIWAK
ncbi:MAG: MATE family efflux transporter [Bacteroidales bacterium]|nr:MATE family efflux transporter [Bacteroidales bacterium]